MGRLPVTMACLLSTLLLAEMSGAAKAAAVTTVPVFPMIPSNQGSKDFQVLVSVEAPEGPRVPIDLVVVHSVSDDKLFAKTSKAMVFISKQLQLAEKIDHLTIVGPADGDEGPVVDSVAGSDEANEKMKKHSMARAESTPFEALLQKATTILDGWRGPERAGAIIVLTDRLDGLSDEVVNRSSGRDYPVHTFGLGAKHDSVALRGLASASTGGTYSFVDDDNLGHITAALAVCVGGLKDVVVPGTSVLKLEAAAGVTLKAVLYGARGGRLASEDEIVVIKMGALHAGETQKMVVYLDVQAEVDEPRRQDYGGCGGKTLLTASFFRSGDDDVPAHKAAVCVQRPQQGAVVPAGAPSPLVLQQIVRMKLLQMVVRISSRGSSGDMLVKDLVAEWGAFVQIHQYWSGVDAFLGLLQEEMDAMVVYAASSHSAYHVVNSWISSHETQRPTAMGSHNNVVAQFLREEVKIMVQVEIQQRSVDCPERNCFDALELAQLILVAMKEKRLHGKPCREIDGMLSSLQLPQ